MKAYNNIHLELEAIQAIQSATDEQTPVSGAVEDEAGQSAGEGLPQPCAAVMVESDCAPNLHSSQHNVLDTAAVMLTAGAITTPQPVLARFNSTQSNQIVVSSLNRSIPGLADNPVDNAAVQYGLNGIIPEEFLPTVMTSLRQGRYHQALKVLMARYGLYISFVKFVVMFGVAIAGLWIAIAEPHQTIAWIERRE